MKLSKEDKELRELKMHALAGKQRMEETQARHSAGLLAELRSLEGLDESDVRKIMTDSGWGAEYEADRILKADQWAIAQLILIIAFTYLLGVFLAGGF